MRCLPFSVFVADRRLVAGWKRPAKHSAEVERSSLRKWKGKAPMSEGSCTTGNSNSNSCSKSQVGPPNLLCLQSICCYTRRQKVYFAAALLAGWPMLAGALECRRSCGRGLGEKWLTLWNAASAVAAALATYCSCCCCWGPSVGICLRLLPFKDRQGGNLGSVPQRNPEEEEAPSVSVGEVETAAEGVLTASQQLEVIRGSHS